MAMVKTPSEIKKLEKAARIANSCIPIIRKSIREGATEKEIARLVKENVYRQGGRLSFRTLVASGERSAMIHPKPSATVRRVDGMGYVDFGASWKGYKVDVTVPFVKGRAGAEERKIIKSVIGAYEKTVSAWRHGRPCWELHKVADDYITSRGLWMGHSVGHGIGLKIHERPIMGMPRKKLVGKSMKKWERIKKVSFESGMAFTIEPGAYVPGTGGCRLENSFLVSGKRLKALTKAKLIEV